MLEPSSDNKIDEEQLMRMNAARRAANWASDTIRDSEMVKTLKEGIYGKEGSLHRHKFREADKSKEMSSRPFLNRTFLRTKARAKLAEKRNRAVLQSHGPYNDRKRREVRQGRMRKAHKERGEKMRYGVRTELERVQKAAEFNWAKDYGERDMEMVHYPNWRKDDKSKFYGMRRGKSAGEFMKYRNNFKLGSKAAWKEVPLRLKGEVKEYKEGLAKLGNDLTLKKRDKSKEVSRP